MGQKVHPYGLRVGVTKDWLAKWYAKDKDFPNILVEDIKIRNYIKEKLYLAGIPQIVIERASNRIKIDKRIG